MKRLFILLPAMNANSHGTAKLGEKRHWQYLVPLEQVTGRRSGHRSGYRSQATGQVTGHKRKQEDTGQNCS